ncbi:hypothetical protein [Streptomyces sp. NPDC058751]|uniref:hypothetical protein n=1 Tax=Streptomyces sp. NPDC058751 TaxID=3346623 RepID=UPI0036756D17
MAQPAPSRRTVGLIVGIALLVIGAILAAFAVFGGGDGTTAPEPSTSPTSARPSAPEPTPNQPTPSPTAPEPSPTSCNIFDPECPGGTGGTSNGSGA